MANETRKATLAEMTDDESRFQEEHARSEQIISRALRGEGTQIEVLGAIAFQLREVVGSLWIDGKNLAHIGDDLSESLNDEEREPLGVTAAKILEQLRRLG